MKKAELNIAIIGAGIGGLTAAITLLQRGFKVQIYERSEELKESNAAITLFPNALRVLHHFGMSEEVYSMGKEVGQFTLATSKNNVLRTLDFAEEEFHPVTIMREHLYSILLKRLPEGIVNYGYTLRDYEIFDDMVSIVFTNEKQIKSDLLIGADGFSSKVRGLMLRDDDPVYQGYQVWRGVIDSPFPDILEKGTMQFWGRGKRFGFMPLEDNKIAWWAASKESIHRINHMNADRKKKVYKYFRNWSYPVPELIKATDDHLIIKAGCYARIPAKVWSEELVTLLGEAAHSISPNLGLGVSLAIEDAAIIARCLDKYHTIEDALLYYEDARINRTQTITQDVLEIVRKGHLKKSFAIRIRNLILKYTPQSKVDKKLGEIFDYNALKVKI